MFFQRPQHNNMLFTIVKLALSFIAGLAFAYFLFSRILK